MRSLFHFNKTAIPDDWHSQKLIDVLTVPDGSIFLNRSIFKLLLKTI